MKFLLKIQCMKAFWRDWKLLMYSTGLESQLIHHTVQNMDGKLQKKMCSSVLCVIGTLVLVSLHHPRIYHVRKFSKILWKPRLNFSFVIDKEACSKLVQRLASAHSKFCLYSTNPLPDSVLKIEHLSNIVLQNKIQVELLDFKNIEFKCEIPQEEKVFFVRQSSVTSLNDIRLWFWIKVVEIFDWLSKMADLPDVHLSSFTLVLTGWQFLKNDMLLKCNYCNRKWSLEPYLTPSNDKHDQLIVNPVTQHQRWCAWRADIHGWESRLLQLQNWKESRNREKRSRLSSDTYVRRLWIGRVSLSNCSFFAGLLAWRYESRP